MTLKNKYIKFLSGLLFIAFYPSFAPNSQIKAAEVCQDNPTTFPNSCSKTPLVYKPRIFEMGFCTSDPLTGTTNSTGLNQGTVTDNEIDESSCFSTFKSEAGSVIDLAKIGQPYVLEGENTRPEIGTYPYMYIKISNTITLKGEQLVNNVPFYSSSDGTATKNINNFVQWDNKVIDFEKGIQCEPLAKNRLMAVAGEYTTGETGTLKALLTHINNGRMEGTTQTDCGISTHIYGSFKPTNPIIITKSTNGLEVTFTITDTGLSIVPWSGNDDSEVGYFSTGAFIPRFKAF